jgi:hypothetical protein
MRCRPLVQLTTNNKQTAINASKQTTALRAISLRASAPI